VSASPRCSAEENGACFIVKDRGATRWRYCEPSRGPVSGQSSDQGTGLRAEAAEAISFGRR
jgi:hypothetical protein